MYRLYKGSDTMTDSTFEQDWGFASDVKATIEGAVYYDVRPTPENFKTGRAKFECLFLDASKNRVIETRTAMRLISKKTGKSYEVVSRKPDSQPAARQPAAPPSQPAAPYTLDDAINA